VRIDAMGYPATIDQAGADAVTARRDGYDGWWATETKIDALLAAAVAAERTEELEIGTGIAVAFARNPMSVAVQANDLQALSGGRFLLGLGSQIKPHITKRFSMEWSRPAARMREFVLAIRAIWHAWETGDPLAFRGEFYRHTLMTPFFDPGPNPHGNPAVFLAAVGPLMTEVAGEVGDGMLCHAFSTERYLREVTLPALRRGREKAGKTLEGFQLTAPAMVAAGEDEEQLTAALAAVRQQLAFYGSTPAYRPVLEVHGWGDLQTELNTMTRDGAWDRMGELITDEVVAAFAVVGSPEEVVEELLRRYGDVASRVTITMPAQRDEARWASALERLRVGGAG
jgi:probable F420-dependent oxidoreductase